MRQPTDHPIFKIPNEKLFKILEELDKAIKWRGWDQRSLTYISHASAQISKIANIFKECGFEYEEYT